MSDHVFTAEQLRRRGIHGRRLTDQLKRGVLHRLLPGVFCDRRPTTADKCRAVGLWRADAVLSHATAAWLHGFWSEPTVVEAYVSSEPDQPVPSWLRLHIAPLETIVASAMRL